ncbi:hypothetical protein PTKIN_Ptkin15bG0157900 [Pterospermum kingtungense]
MAHPFLLGPPELRNPTPPPPPPQSQSQTSTAPSNPFMDLMVANFNKANDSPPSSPPMGFTENMSATFLSSGNPCLDFFDKENLKKSCRRKE